MDKEIVHELAAAVMPSTPIYTALRSEGAPESLQIGEALACFGRANDLVAMGYLQARGEWNGRRPLVYFNDISISNIAATQHTAHGLTRREMEDEFAVGIAIHEFAHATEILPDYSEPSVSRVGFANFVAAYSAVELTSGDRPPFDGHGWRWVRNCCHLYHRAKLAGFDCPAHFIFSGENYQLPEFEQFLYAINGAFELSNLERVSIFEINRFRPPHHFVDLWKGAVRYWLAQQTAYSPAISTALQMLEVEPDEEN